MRVVGWLGLAASAAGAGPARSAAQTPVRAPVVQAARFVLTQYASKGTVSAYAAYGTGPVAALIGLVRTPRTGAQTLVVGVGTRVRLNARSGVAVFAALADGTSGPSVRFYVLPALRGPRVELSGTAAAQLPLNAGRPWKAALDPVTLSVRVTPAVGLGAAGVIRREADGTVVAGLGPAAAVRVARTNVRGEVVRIGGSGGLEARVSLAVAY